MWKSIGALLTRAGEALGIEVPELPGVGAVGDTVTGAVDAVRGQAGETVTSVSQTLSGAAGDVAVTAGSVGETVTGAADQAAGDVTSAVDRLRG
jgi:hypothetical protein